jgi:hypothetical protein
MLQRAGVRWLRLFPEWQVIQPKKDQWNWTVSDAMVANARANNIQLVAIWAYLAPWASADGGTRKFPIKSIQYWSDYIKGTVARYKNDIKYWEVWNEFNGSFGDSKNKVKDYAELVVTAYDAAKKVDPDARIGLSVANFDVGFLDAVIKAGAADHFDFICVHPYENLGAVAEGGEVGYLSLAGNLRKMLAANKQRADIPLWITEIGFQAPIKPDAKGDAEQAEMLIKAYLLSIVQGFDKIFWFEARGPAYGKGTDHGIIRPDWTLRPAYVALKTMTTLLGQEPRYLGWLEVGKGGYGFLFKGDQENVLVAWSSPSRQAKTTFDGAVVVTDLTGMTSQLLAGEERVLTPRPVFLTGVPTDLVTQAQGNIRKPYPWGGDYANARVVTCRLGASNTEDGLKQINPKTTVVVNELTESYRRPDFANPALKNEGRYIYFRIDPQFVPFGTRELEISIIAKAAGPRQGSRDEPHLRVHDGLHGGEKLVDDPQRRQVVRAHLEGQRCQFRWPVGVELPFRCDRLTQRVPDQGSAREEAGAEDAVIRSMIVVWRHIRAIFQTGVTGGEVTSRFARRVTLSEVGFSQLAI